MEVPQQQNQNEQAAMPQPEQAVSVEPEYQTINVGGNEFEIEKGASPEAIQKAIDHFIRTPKFYSTIDKRSGSNFDVRKAVGDSLKPEDKLATLRKFYKDAVPYEDDNFIYTDPKTGRMKLHNPKGFDIGDIAGSAREISIGVGSTLGAIFGAAGGTIAGAPMGPGAFATGTLGGVAGAGWGAAATASVYDFLSATLGPTVRTEGPVEMVSEIATEGMSAAAGQRIGDVVIPAAIGGVKNILGGGTAKSQAIYDTLVAHGIRPTAGAVTGGRGAGRLESALDQAAASATTMRNQIDDVMRGAQAATEDLAAKFGTARSQQGTGMQMQSAADKAIEAFKLEQGRLETRLGAAIGEDAPFSIDALRALYDELRSMGTSMPAFSQRAYGSVMDVLNGLMDDAARNGGRIPYSAFREVRTFFGGKMSDMTEGVNKSLYKRLYAAMSEDLQFGADARGLKGMFDDTVNFTKNFKQDYSDLLEKITDLDAPERAYRFLMNSRRDGGTFFLKLKDQFKPDEWADVSATVIQKMGYKNFGNEADDAFSINTFLTNYRSISDEAKDALFKNIPGGKDLSKNLDELVGVFESMAQNARLGNASNTAGAAHTLSLMDALGGNVTTLLWAGMAAGGNIPLALGGLAATIGGKVVTPLAASKLITNPAFVKWLAEGPAVRTGAEVGQHMGRLLAIYEANPAIRDALDNFIDKMKATEQGEQQ